jgi:phospholipase/carboxylesterase
MALDELVHRSRPAAGDPEGALVLMHGRGVDENDLFGLLDILDPERRLAGFTPRAPLTPPGHTGNHWYVIQRVGYPEPASFAETYGRLGRWLDSVAEETGVGPERMVLGGFSQGAVMSQATGLGTDRPRPAAIVALSGFVPNVDGWRPDLEGRRDLPVYVSHGVADQVIPVELDRAARDLLEGNVDLTYRETPAAHWIDPRTLDEVRAWIEGALDRAG